MQTAVWLFIAVQLSSACHGTGTPTDWQQMDWVYCFGPCFRGCAPGIKCTAVRACNIPQIPCLRASEMTMRFCRLSSEAWKNNNASQNLSLIINRVINLIICLGRMSSSPQKNDRLLIRQKDYELLAIKRAKQFQVSINDPLINPPKKRSTRKAPIGFEAASKREANSSNNSMMQLNPLTRRTTTKIPSKNEQAAPVTQIAIPVVLEEQNKPNEGTPWQTILGYFLKVYDYRPDQYQLKLVNVFGSQGIKQQQELRLKLNGPPRQSTVSFKKSQTKQKDEEPTKQITTVCLSTYMKILSLNKKQLKDKWKKQDKVASLQVTIQSLKLLHDTSNAKFHAIKFAHIMEIVEEFGINVFQRIKKLSFPSLSQERIQQISIKDIEGANIPESAQEICKNWINKISSIREVIPRVFVQTTLLRLYFFIDNGAHARRILKRLARSNRCFGEYINCIFFCTFLIRIGKEVLPQEKDFILDILDDVFFYIKQGKTKFNRDDISQDEFFTILQPFFISSFESLSESLSKEKFKRFCQILPQNPHPVILKNFILSFSPSLLVNYSVDIATILQKIHSEQKYVIYKLLMERLAGYTFPQSGEFIILVWTDLSQIKNLEIMLDLLGPFSEIVFRNLPRYQKNRFYSLILEAFNNLFYNFRNTQKKIYDSFQKFLIGILEKTEDMKDILSLEPFLQVISYFPVKNKRQISQSISKTFLSRNQMIHDPVIVHILLSLMKNMQGMPVKDLALNFSAKVDLKGDFEQTLSFLAEMRAIFGYMPEVTTALIYKAVNLTFTARRNAKGRITKKLVSFLQATLAYCYITVPVIEDGKIKLKLYLYLSEIALANNLISQATSLIKTCITQLAETPLDSDVDTYQIFHRIISFLIVMPDDPETDYLFLFNGLYQAFNVAKLKTNLQHVIKFQFYTQCLVYISCQAQEKLPFHIQGVISNDGLFKSTDFRVALITRIQEVFADMESIVKNIGSVEGPQIDIYVLRNLISCVLTLTSIFQTTPRFKTLITELCRIIEKGRDKVFRDVRHERKYAPALKGLKARLEQCEIQCKIKV